MYCWRDGRHTLAGEGFSSLAELIEGRLTRDDIMELGPELRLRVRKLLQVPSWFRYLKLNFH